MTAAEFLEQVEKMEEIIRQITIEVQIMRTVALELMRMEEREKDKQKAKVNA